jgi:DNA-binding transcriptional ArsR family regulator
MTNRHRHAQALAALGHEARLDVFRLLVRAGRDGLSVGDIGAHTEQPASTLAHHLRTLVQAGLVTQERQGRTVLNFADFEAVERTTRFLTAECCAGVALVREEVA